MELSIEKPLKLTIHSSNSELLKTNITVSAHRNTKVFRLLQYLHFQLCTLHSDDGFHVDDVSLYCLKDSNQVLPLDSDLLDLGISDSQPCHTLNIELVENRSGTALNLDYDPLTDFGTTNIKYVVNTLSKYRFLHEIQREVPLSTKLSKLERNALDHLIFEENFLSGDNFCKLKDNHTLNDILGLQFKGQDKMIGSSAEEMDFYIDCTVKDLLQIDFTPFKASVFTLMVYTKHEQMINHMTNPTKIELISDSKLFQKYPIVDSNTSVKDIRQFIGNVYAASEAVRLDDIKLIYKGQLVHDKNFVGNDATVMSYIDANRITKFHVQVRKREFDLVDNFWLEPSLVDDIPDIADTEFNVIGGTSNNNGSNDSNFDFLQENGLNQFHYATESGDAIEISSTDYNSNNELMKCSINGREEVFINKKEFDPLISTLSLDNSNTVIPLSSLGNDYIIEDNYLRISPEVIKKIEHETNVQIMYRCSLDGNTLENNSATIEEILDSHNQNANRNITFTDRTLPQKIVFVSFKILELFKIVLLTIFYLFSNSFFALLINLELGNFLPDIVILPLLLIHVIRVLFTSPEISVMWVDFFKLNRLKEEDYLQVKKFVDSGLLTSEFYEKCQKDEKIFSNFMLEGLEDVRFELYEINNINQLGNMTDLDSLKELFRQIKSNQTELSDDKKLIDRLFLIDELARFDEKEQLNFNRLLVLIKQEIELTDLEAIEPVRRSIIIIRERITELPGQFIEKIVPNPLQDDYVMAIFKNILLFMLLLLPFVREKIDVVIQERVNERNQVNIQMNEDNSNNDTDETIETNHDTDEIEEEIIGIENINENNNLDYTAINTTGASVHEEQN